MRYVLMVAVALGGLVGACSVKTERTVVERPPTAVPASTVVYTTDPAPVASSTTVRVGP
ncbi:MAG: hypothetical protein KIT25_16805 [Enhydrobacter sp.]|nr:MAG: hypothetical protein KIT25_16805 [Enhydrobacter sp.]